MKQGREKIVKNKGNTNEEEEEREKRYKQNTRGK